MPTPEEVFQSVGGVPFVQAGMDPQDPANVIWNFGVAPSTPLVRCDAGPSFYEVFPNLQGRWDGKSNVNHHSAAKKVLGKDLPAHNQPTGTCGGRAGSRGSELLQLVLIANGKRAKFHYVSHAWIYYLARKEYNMLGGGDGVASGAVPPVMAKYGLLNREESNDLEYAGKNSDKLAGKWGNGNISKEEYNSFSAMAADNLITAMVRCKSASECADALASGGILIQSDMQGYSMNRDNDGFCQAQGQWAHYQVRSGIVVRPSGRKGFAYDQSWGDTTPDGPLLEGYPGNCFGVDWDVQDSLCRSGVVHAVFGLDLWDMEKGKIDIDWVW